MAEDCASGLEHIDDQNGIFERKEGDGGRGGTVYQSVTGVRDSFVWVSYPVYTSTRKGAKSTRGSDCIVI